MNTTPKTLAEQQARASDALIELDEEQPEAYPSTRAKRHAKRDKAAAAEAKRAEAERTKQRAERSARRRAEEEQQPE
jgi:hypothetical protein